MLCIWWSVLVVGFLELLAEGSTVIAEVYLEQVRNLKANLENARPQQHEVYYQRDNARPHIARTTKAEQRNHFTTPTVFFRLSSLGRSPSFPSPTSSGR
ncbi:hypothetical protein ANCDUO_25448 [Ancylostoma duodenale]|uniref:Tc1-like transposase DDE domain-containing protein n=1 Tax=Ancylostoma duodenale TaxID=51022 RepID=A0A0C2FHV7_9BILA|nr:hypothetical protein ANCDUO_25448 [Ancylostoma duodenale]